MSMKHLIFQHKNKIHKIMNLIHIINKLTTNLFSKILNLIYKKIKSLINRLLLNFKIT